MHQYNIILRLIIILLSNCACLHFTSIPVSGGGQRKGILSRTLAHSICVLANEFSDTGKIQKPIKNWNLRFQEDKTNWESIKWTKCMNSTYGAQETKCKKFSLKRRPRQKGTGGRSFSKKIHHHESTTENMINMMGRSSSSRIYGGVEAIPHSFPWAVDLIQMHDCSHTCGGTLIDSHLVLSAAHCFQGGERLVVVAGEHNRSLYEGTEQYRHVRKLLTHHSYDMSLNHSMNWPFRTDLAVVLFDPPFRFDIYVHPISLILVDPISFPLGTYFTAAGWGSYDYTNKSSDVLKTIQLPLLNDSLCATIQNTNRSRVHHTGEFCVGLEPGESICRGDSGGGLIIEINGDKYLAGVAGFISYCGYSPGFFTNVNHAGQWIVDAARFINTSAIPLIPVPTPKPRPRP